MAFPSSPTNGQLATVNGIIYQYGSTYRTWTRVVGSIGNLTTTTLTVTSNANIGTTLSATGGIQSTPIGNATASSGAFTTLNATGAITGATTITTTGAATASTITSNGSITLNSANVATALINGGPAGAGNIGASGQGFNTVFAKATSAQYADLAEKYSADAEYAPGTVVVFGGPKEITISTKLADNKVAGVISTNPAYQMNSELEDGLYVALTGRVPCNVVGKIEKGNMLVTSSLPGVATAVDDPKLGQVIGKALGDYNSDNVGTIEVVVGRM